MMRQVRFVSKDGLSKLEWWDCGEHGRPPPRIQRACFGFNPRPILEPLRATSKLASSPIRTYEYYSCDGYGRYDVHEYREAP